MHATRLAGALIVAAGLLFSGACGGGHAKIAGAVSAGARSPATTVQGGDQGLSAKGSPAGSVSVVPPALNVQLKFSNCLKQHGASMPGSAAALTPRQQLAEQQCAAVLPGGVNAKLLAKVEQFRACMSKHGAPLPPAGRPFTLKTEDPKVVAALQSCKSLLPKS